MRTTTTVLLAAATAASLAFAPLMAGTAHRPLASGQPAPVGADGVLTADELPPFCADGVDGTYPFEVEVDGEVARGAIALPAARFPFDPRGLVVFAHGYGHSSASWLSHLEWAAEELGVVAVAMDYRGTQQLPPPGEFGGTRGWQVREGAADSNAAATAVLEACPDTGRATIFGVSMGANAAGLAIAAQPTRPDDADAPLYQWWINVEGATNVVETYLEARSLAASGNEFANNAVEDIEREMGGPMEADPAGYADLAVVTHAQEIGDSGLQGVFHVHGVDDGLVPHNQSRELWAALATTSVGQEFWTALRRDPDGPNPDEDQTNATDYAVNPLDPGYESPFVGHGSEASAENDVMKFSFERLRRLYVEGDPVINCEEGLYDAGTEDELVAGGCIGRALP